MNRYRSNRTPYGIDMTADFRAARKVRMLKCILALIGVALFTALSVGLIFEVIGNWRIGVAVVIGGTTAAWGISGLRYLLKP
jgi:hypothetical protein